MTLAPTVRLDRGATYRAAVRAAAKDEAGNPLVRPKKSALHGRDAVGCGIPRSSPGRVREGC